MLRQRLSTVALNGSLLALFNRRLSTTVFGWGSNDGGELGAGLGSDDQLIPKVLTSFKNFDAVCCGYGTTYLYRRSSPDIFSFGLNTVGQLGFNRKSAGNVIQLESNIITAAAGRAHALILTNDEVLATGSNIQGQCGLEPDKKFTNNFEKIELPFHASHIKQICCGLDNSVILTKDGKVFTCGLGADGQTGIGSYHCQYGFVQVLGDINSHFIIQVSSTTDTCLALSDDGCVFGWGNNEQAQISHEITEKQIAVPLQMSACESFSNICQVLAGGSFSAIFADGGVFIQGYGALGIGPDNIEVKSATKVEFDQSHGKIAMISGSADYLAALTDIGHLLTWGRGNHGRLGHGNIMDHFYPKKVQLPGQVIGFCCGNDHMVAIVSNDSKKPP